MLVSWNWLKDYLGETPLTATDAAELLGAHAFEIEGIEETDTDTVIDVDILPNRSSDCLCHRGIARELASITGTPLVADPLRQDIDLPETSDIQVAISDAAACPRFTASRVRNVVVKESPEWLQRRLAAIGQRSINNIVDATNYVMFAIGQPIHAYDADLFPQVDGVWKFVVRYAREEEEVALIPEAGATENRVVTCQGSELLIVDGSSDTPIGLAGVKGGSFAGVHSGTKQIIIEAAHFDPAVTRKTARRLGIVIDASKRFENEPSRELLPYTQAEITKLITDIANGSLAGAVDVYPEPATPAVTQVNPARVNALLGLELATDDMVGLLERMGATVQQTADGLTVTAPWERTDLTIEEDYVEEIGRLHGYQYITAVKPQPKPVTEFSSRHYYSEQIRQVLLEAGFSEVITSSFRKKDSIQLKNALASDKSCLRSSLRRNISEALDKNAGFTDLLGTPDIRLFEIGTVFTKTEDGVAEHTALAIGLRCNASGYSGKEDKLLQPALDAVAASLGVSLDWQIEKGVAELNLSQLLTDLPTPTAYEPVTVGEEIMYQPFSLYPHTSRDIAMWVDEGTTADDVLAVLNEQAGPLRVRTTLFDEFSKDGRTSYAFRLVFQSHKKTLTDSEVSDIMDAVYAAVSERGWEVR